MSEKLVQTAQDILKEGDLQSQYDKLNKSMLPMRDMNLIAEKLGVYLKSTNRHSAKTELLDAMMVKIVEENSGEPPQKITVYEYVRDNCTLNQLYNIYKEFSDDENSQMGVPMSERPVSNKIMTELNGLRDGGKYRLFTRDSWGKVYPHDLREVVFMLLAERTVAAIERVKQKR